MMMLDASIVNIGLPSIARAFNTPLDGAVEWIIICYLVMIGGLLLTFGRLSDIIGRSPIWTAGLLHSRLVRRRAARRRRSDC